MQITDGSGKVNFNMNGNLNAGKCGTANYSDVVWFGSGKTKIWWKNSKSVRKIHVLTMQNRV